MSFDQPTPATEPTPKDMNIIARIWNVFVSPTSTFEAVRSKPRWVLPLIIILLITGAAMYVLTPIVMEEGREKMIEQMEKRGVPEDQMDTAVERAAQFQKYSIAPSTIIAGAIFTFLLAAFWLFVTNVLAGGSARYAQVLGAYVYAGFIGLLGFLIKLPVMWFRQTMNIHISPATLMSESATETFLYKLLAKFDLFSIWGMIVLGIGLAVVGGLKPKKVLPWVVILYVLFWVASASLSNLSFF
ncbi:YIP1 family protein [candidate division KSB1 bacterium]|nr:YIP1 family protein [candidate division KSB1 bacterium]